MISVFAIDFLHYSTAGGSVLLHYYIQIRQKISVAGLPEKCLVVCSAFIFNTVSGFEAKVDFSF